MYSSTLPDVGPGTLHSSSKESQMAFVTAVPHANNTILHLIFFGMFVCVKASSARSSRWTQASCTRARGSLGMAANPRKSFDPLHRADGCANVLLI